MSRKCLVFDLDGTLLDSRLDLANTVNQMLRFYGKPPLPMEKILTLVGDGRKKLMERAISEAQLKNVDMDEAYEVMKRSYLANLNLASSLYPGVYRTIRDLHGDGWKIALLSNKNEDCCKATLCEFGLAPYFDLIVGDNGDIPLKPEPDGLEFILDMLSIDDREHSWMIGDSEPDLLVGKRCGLRCCYAAFGFGNDLNGAAYDAAIQDFASLKEVVS